MSEPNFTEERSSHGERIRTFFTILISCLGGRIVAVYLLPSRQKGLSHSQTNKLDEVIKYVNAYYVDTVNTDKLFETAINAMLQGLDPHSTYANATDNKAMMESLEGAFEGVGIQFSIMNDTIMVVSTITGGPSEKQGIRAGDRIVKVDDKVVAGVGIQNEDVMKMLRGKKKTTVKIGIMRDGFKQVYDYTVTRDVIPTYTLDIAYMIDDHTGYIKINQFGATTGKEFSEAISKLKKKGMSKMILDLRSNSGGFLDAAIQVCDEFLPKGEMIVYTEGLRVPTDKIYATRYGNFETGEVVVLIDDFSASASEIVAGAIQDNDRGIVIGRRSFGKGLVQRQIDLADKSSIRLTVARYHTPSGRCIQRQYGNGTEAYYEDFIDRYYRGEMNHADSIKFDENQKFITKKGRIVYGGGGIMPDYFIPLDEDSTLNAFYQVLNSSAIIQFAFNYATENKATLLKQYPTANDYVQEMTISNDLLKQLLNFYTQKNGQKVQNINNESIKELKIWLKALIGRDVYKDEAFYPVINSNDKAILKALSIQK
ncbi:MAG: S41 family peptidase [Bacteroidales bacterium]|nr:S41 family peptidase [Bacteroidales bacterium]